MSIIEDIRSEIKRRLRKGIFEEETAQESKRYRGTITITIYNVESILGTETQPTFIIGEFQGKNMRIRVQVNHDVVFSEGNLSAVGISISFTHIERNLRFYEISKDFVELEYIGSVSIRLTRKDIVEIEGMD
jgi:hypothetical protein